MADIWSGDILLPNSDLIRDITLATQKGASASIIPTNPLRFLSTVDTARIPLYLAVGPSLEVWTASEATEEWFASILFSKPTVAPGVAHARQWWAQARAQSPVGILVKVDEGYSKLHGVKITEVLFYGTVTTSRNAAPGVLPTPPSSSPEHPHEQEEQPVVELPELRVHALPLSSDHLYQDGLREIPPQSADDRTDVQPQFLPHRSLEITPVSPKRKIDLFEEAAEAQKKARNAAAAAVAAAAKEQEAQLRFGHRKSNSFDNKFPSFSESRPGTAHGIRDASRPLSRSPSISFDSRPFSRKGVQEGHVKKSGLSNVATIPLHPEPEEMTIETRNKEALSRIVMTAMRMHGLQQRKKLKSRRGSIAPGQDQPSEENVEDAAKDEEYKVIYHQTYKGAVLALRNHMATAPLHTLPDRLRDVVEKLLSIFCTDPLAQPLSSDSTMHVSASSNDTIATPGGLVRRRGEISGQNDASPFDMPSTARRQAGKVTGGGGVMNTGSPVSKRRQRQKEAVL